MGFLGRLLSGRSDTEPELHPTVPHTWLQRYSFRAAGHEVPIVGESNYQDALEAACGGRTHGGARVPLVTATLIREPRNRYDRNAVRVDLDGRCVGYIPRDLAPSFGPVLAQVAHAGISPTCRAWLRGGWDRGVLDRGQFGIVLDLHPDLQVAANAPILPFGNGRVSITGEEAAQDYLSSLLDGQERSQVIASLAIGEGDRLAVDLGGTKVGALTAKMSARYAPWVSEVLAAGIDEATCETRVIRGTNKVEVFLKLAKPWARDHPETIS